MSVPGSEDFERLLAEMLAAGFVGFYRKSYVVIGTHRSLGEIAAIQNAIMVTRNNTQWIIKTTWPGQVGQRFTEIDLPSTLSLVFSLLKFKEHKD